MKAKVMRGTDRRGKEVVASNSDRRCWNVVILINVLGLMATIFPFLSTLWQDLGLVHLFFYPSIDIWLSSDRVGLGTTSTSITTTVMTGVRITEQGLVIDWSVEPSNSTTNRKCISSFSPVCEMYPYVRYWKKQFVEKDCYESPLSTRTLPYSKQKYVVFEPDRGAWNNIRMAAEVAIVFAHATGRTLVLPPSSERWYLLDMNTKKKRKDMRREHHGNPKHSDEGRFDKFFNFTKTRETMNVITMSEFFERMAIPGHLKKPSPIQTVTDLKAQGPPGSRIGWLWKYLEEATYLRTWEPGKFFIGLNLREPRDRPTAPNFKRFTRNVTDRLTEMRAHGRAMIEYDSSMHNEQVIYFPGDYRREFRILTHFYTYLYFQDEHREHFYKRYVRDRMHYIDDIFCAAGRVLRMIHEDAARISGIPNEVSMDPITGGGNTNEGPTFFAYHIRRGDFQYKNTRLPAATILGATKHLLDAYSNRTRLLYIATDERNASFFDPFRDHFEVRLLGDYFQRAGLQHMDGNLIGMVEQVITANAHTFVGTYASTFTGYITRMRGYYRDGRYNRSYYTTKKDMYHLQKKRGIVGPFWAREFETAHMQIDDDTALARRRLILLDI